MTWHIMAKNQLVTHALNDDKIASDTVRQIRAAAFLLQNFWFLHKFGNFYQDAWKFAPVNFKPLSSSFILLRLINVSMASTVDSCCLWGQEKSHPITTVVFIWESTRPNLCSKLALFKTSWQMLKVVLCCFLSSVQTNMTRGFQMSYYSFS